MPQVHRLAPVSDAAQLSPTVACADAVSGAAFVIGATTGVVGTKTIAPYEQPPPCRHLSLATYSATMPAGAAPPGVARMAPAGSVTPGTEGVGDGTAAGAVFTETDGAGQGAHVCVQPDDAHSSQQPHALQTWFPLNV